ncbi:hypothetical protein E2C01_091534 [Portunus trituberculatus]|nr:hypothetical protein [Portunus trituberculatus]
MSSPGTR